MDDKNITDLLQYAVEHDMIDLANISAKAEMKKREEIISQHPHKIWQGKDGKWRTYIDAPGYTKNLKLVCKKERKDLEDAIIAAYQEEPKKIHTFGQMFHEWNDKRMEDRYISKASHRIYLEVFTYSFTDPKVRELDLSKSTVGFWQDFLEGIAPNCCSETFGKVKTIVRGVLTKAKRNGYIDHSVGDIFETLQVSPKQFKDAKHDESEEVYAEVEVKKLEAYLTENPTVANLALLLLFVTGMRIGELIVLNQNDFKDDYTISVNKTISHIWEDGKKIEVISDSAKTQNGNRTVPVPKPYYWLFDEIKAMFQANTIYAFKAPIRDSYISSHDIRYALTKACKKCSVKYKSLHKIRKTYCTMLLDENVNPKTVAKIAGHSTPAMTLRVYNKDRTSDAEKKECVDKAFSNRLNTP